MSVSEQVLMIEHRLRTHGITPTVEACSAYRLGRFDVMSDYDLECEMNNNQTQTEPSNKEKTNDGH